MNYQHMFLVDAPVQAVLEFHTKSASLPAITPPPLTVDIHHAPETLTAGDNMDFTLHCGPFALKWAARIENTHQHGFIDSQQDGPFHSWSHQHTFIPMGPETTAVLDEVNLTLHTDFKRRLIGLGMWLGLPFLFGYRAWKTKRLLTKSSKKPLHLFPFSTSG